MFRTRALRLVAAAGLAGPAGARAAPVELPALGLRVELPNGWTPADSGPDRLRAAGPDGAVLAIWATPGEVHPAPSDAGELTRLHGAALRAELGDSGLELVPLGAEAVALAGGAGLRADLEVRAAGRRGRARAWAFPAAGQTVHARVFAGEAAGTRPATAVEAALAAARLQPGPSALPGPQLQLPGLADAALPEGWRAPVPPERAALEARLAALGLTAGPGCAFALMPSLEGAGADLLACAVDLPLGPLEGGGAPAVAAEAAEALGLPPGSLRPTRAGGRAALRAELAAGPALAVLVVPARAGGLVAWASGGPPGAAAAAVDALGGSLRWSGPDGAAHQPPLRARLRALPPGSVAGAIGVGLLVAQVAVRAGRRRAPAAASAGRPTPPGPSTPAGPDGRR